MIINQNPNAKAIDVYALVLNNTVVNTILACYNDILSIYQTYDYCVDVTMQGQQNCSIGDTYNGSQNLFIPPPAPVIDWVQNVETDFDNVINDIQQILNDCGQSGGDLDGQQINAAYNSAINDNPGLDAPTLTLIGQIYNYILAGG